MSFVQIVELRTSNPDKLIALEREWEQATDGERTARRRILTRDRNRPDRYLEIVFFDSYESAQENSNLAATRDFAERFTALVDGPVDFHDLDVISDQT